MSSITFFDNFFSFIFHFTLPYFFPSPSWTDSTLCIGNQILSAWLKLSHSFLYLPVRNPVYFEDWRTMRFELVITHNRFYICIYVYLHTWYDYTCIICYRKAFGPVYYTNIYPCAERIYTEIVIRYFVWFCAPPPLLLWHTAASKALQISNIQNMLFSYNALTRIAYIIWEQPKL